MDVKKDGDKKGTHMIVTDLLREPRLLPIPLVLTPERQPSVSLGHGQHVARDREAQAPRGVPGLGQQHRNPDGRRGRLGPQDDLAVPPGRGEHVPDADADGRGPREVRYPVLVALELALPLPRRTAVVRLGVGRYPHLDERIGASGYEQRWRFAGRLRHPACWAPRDDGYAVRVSRGNVCNRLKSKKKKKKPQNTG